MVKVIIMDWLRKEANICNLNIMIDFIIENLRKDVKVTKHVDMEIRLVCEEALMNIINYAYPKGHGEMIAGYEYAKENNCLTLKVCDYGIEFNPIKENNPDITSDIMERSIGGLGIFLLKKISDIIEYERRENMNVLTIKKHYQSL